MSLLSPLEKRTAAGSLPPTVPEFSSFYPVFSSAARNWGKFPPVCTVSEISIISRVPASPSGAQPVTAVVLQQKASRRRETRGRCSCTPAGSNSGADLHSSWRDLLEQGEKGVSTLTSPPTHGAQAEGPRAKPVMKLCLGFCNRSNPVRAQLSEV